MTHKTFIESIITIVDGNDLVGIIYNDPEIRKPIIYSCRQMNSEDIAEMISGTKLQIGRSAIPKGSKKLEEVSEVDS